MHIVVHVAEEHLRGTPFDRYESVLGNFIGEAYMPDDVQILRDGAHLRTLAG